MLALDSRKNYLTVYVIFSGFLVFTNYSIIQRQAIIYLNDLQIALLLRSGQAKVDALKFTRRRANVKVESVYLSVHLKILHFSVSH